MSGAIADLENVVTTNRVVVPSEAGRLLRAADAGTLVPGTTTLRMTLEPSER